LSEPTKPDEQEDGRGDRDGERRGAPQTATEEKHVALPREKGASPVGTRATSLARTVVGVDAMVVLPLQTKQAGKAKQTEQTDRQFIVFLNRRVHGRNGVVTVSCAKAAEGAARAKAAVARIAEVSFIKVLLLCATNSTRGA
jgi:hypothetical protein